MDESTVQLDENIFANNNENFNEVSHTDYQHINIHRKVLFKNEMFMS